MHWTLKLTGIQYFNIQELCWSIEWKVI